MPQHNSHPHDPHHHPTIATFLLVFTALMVLMVLTIVFAFIDLSPFNIFIALGIAVIKAMLVVLFFMHVRYSNPLVWVFSAAAFLWLGIMFVLTFQDYLTRGWIVWR